MTTPAPGPPAPDTAALAAGAHAELGTLDAHLDELVAFRQRLEHAAAELTAEYRRLLAVLPENRSSDDAATSGPRSDSKGADGPRR